MSTKLINDRIKAILVDVKKSISNMNAPDGISVTALLFIPIKSFSDDQNEVIEDERGLYFDVGFGLNSDEYAVQPASFGDSPEVFNQTTQENIYTINSIREIDALEKINSNYKSNYTNLISALDGMYSHKFTNQFISNELARRLSNHVDKDSVYLHQIRISPYAPYNKNIKSIPVLGVLYVTNNEPKCSETINGLLIRMSQTFGEVFLHSVAKEILFHNSLGMCGNEIISHNPNFFKNLTDNEQRHEAFHRVLACLHFFFFPTSSFINALRSRSIDFNFNSLLSVYSPAGSNSLSEDTIFDEVSTLMFYFERQTITVRYKQCIVNGVKSVLFYYSSDEYFRSSQIVGYTDKDKNYVKVEKEYVHFSIDEPNHLLIPSSLFDYYKKIQGNKNELEGNKIPLYVDLLYTDKYRIKFPEKTPPVKYIYKDENKKNTTKSINDRDCKSLKFLALATIVKMSHSREKDFFN